MHNNNDYCKGAGRGGRAMGSRSQGGVVVVVGPEEARRGAAAPLREQTDRTICIKCN